VGGDSLPTFGVVDNLPGGDSLPAFEMVDNFLAWVGQDSLPAWVELDIVMDMAVDIETQCSPFSYKFSIVNYAR